MIGLIVAQELVSPPGRAQNKGISTDYGHSDAFRNVDHFSLHHQSEEKDNMTELICKIGVTPPNLCSQAKRGVGRGGGYC